jgi:hypothetical protein
VAVNGDFFGDGEVVAIGVLPVDEGDGFVVFSGVGFDGDAVAEEAIDFLVVVVEAAVGVVGGAEFVDGLGDLGGGVSVLGEVVGEEGVFDVAVVGAIVPVAEVAVAEFVAEEGYDSVLGDSFGVSDVTHGKGCWRWGASFLSVDIMTELKRSDELATI